MTNRERVVEALQKRWAEIQVEKQEKVRELWKLEYESEQIKDKIKKYGCILELA